MTDTITLPRQELQAVLDAYNKYDYTRFPKVKALEAAMLAIRARLAQQEENEIVYDTEEVDATIHALTGYEGEENSLAVLKNMARYINNSWPGKTVWQVFDEHEELLIAQKEKQDLAVLEKVVTEIWQDVGDPRFPSIQSKVIEDCVTHGVGFAKGGKRINPHDLYTDVVSDGGMDPRNTQEEKPGPVAFVEDLVIEKYNKLRHFGPYTDKTPLYAAPPQREWQWLTDEEIKTIAATPAAIPGSYVHSFARAIEAKLKEKNS